MTKDNADDDLRRTFHLAEGCTLQVVITDEGVIMDAFDHDEHVGTSSSLATDLFDDIADADYPYRIVHVQDGSDDEGLYWSNEEGWTTREHATEFTQYEHDTRNLPFGGRWTRV